MFDDGRVATLAIQVKDLVSEADSPLGVGFGELIRADRVMHDVTLDHRVGSGLQRFAPALRHRRLAP